MRKMSLSRVAVVCDFREENWPSMDLVADMLLAHLQQDHSNTVAATRIRPLMRRRFTRDRTSSGELFNADRLLNRFWDYPQLARRSRTKFDLFHVVDHSYAQLVHNFPPERAVITCHDLDTFQCILEPGRERRSAPFKWMVRRTLSGLRKAARVTCDSFATRDQLLAHELVVPDRVVVIPNGVHPAYSSSPDRDADAQAMRLLGHASADDVDVLHVGSTIERKRIDVLLQVFAQLRKGLPQARLVRVGGPFTCEQSKLVDRLNLSESIVVLPRLDEKVLAAVYRRAAVLLLPSEREGFGLPLVEAMACGTPVLASDLPVLREIGGDAAAYCQVGDVQAWSVSLAQALRERREQPGQWAARRAKGIAHAARFGWAEYTRKMVSLYRQLLP